ncbi:hypothetical protein P9743_01115 [Anoxybacillus geothermalis]|nr:hypothetical protein [Anoxybacillus geothermalis]
MKKVLVFDENGNYIEDKIVDDDYETQENEFACSIDTVIAFYKPKLVNGQVVEGLTQEEIDAIKNAPKEPTPIELLQQENEQLKQQLAQVNDDLVALAEMIVSTLQ